MNAGKLIFTQLTEYLRLTTFRRCVARYDGEQKIKRLKFIRLAARPAEEYRAFRHQSRA